MIRLQRPKAPPYFASAEIQGFRAGVRAFFSRSEKTRRQERPDFPLFPRAMYQQLLEDLGGLSHQKCAYCETPLTGGGLSLDRFRPKAGSVGLDGDFSTEHYWWLAYDWANIYPSCLKCNKFKGAKFPVQAARCRTDATWHELKAERRLLVDPFSDQPDEHLDFQTTGMVAPRSSMGDVTIHTLELNRRDLVAGRQSVAAAVQQLIARHPPATDIFQYLSQSSSGTAIPSIAGSTPLHQAIDGSQPFAAVARVMVRQFFEEGRRKRSAAAPAGPRARVPRRQAAGRPVAAFSSAAAAPEVFGATQQERRVSKKAQALRSRIVTRVAVHNFRGVHDLDLTIDYELGDGAPWTVLLGENATGKSSLLQAIALTLLEGDGRGPTATTPAGVLTRGRASGSVRVWLDESTEPRVLSFAKRKRRFARSGPEYPGVLLGYGATRLLPRQSMPETRGRVRLDNMFDPFRPLIDANRWLGQLEPKSFDFVARALKDVLWLPRSARLRRVRRKGVPGVALKLFGTDLALQDLSDGYQSVLGLTCDIIAGLKASSKGALEAAEGLVAIDELGAHLHPRWRMRIVQSLRRAFRRVQFIVSTHDPLCLRGLENGEVVVLRRTSRGHVFAEPDLPPIKGLRVDQLLTSQYFGLSSTMDPEIEQKYRALYRLLALRHPTAAQTQRIAQLRTELAPFDIPGTTRRERRLLEIIDKELAETDQEPSPQKRRAIRQQSSQMVADLNRLIAAGRPLSS